MENTISQDNTQDYKTKLLKRWIFQILADVEVRAIDHASKEGYGDTITLSITFKRE